MLWSFSEWLGTPSPQDQPSEPSSMTPPQQEEFRGFTSPTPPPGIHLLCFGDVGQCPIHFGLVTSRCRADQPFSPLSTQVFTGPRRLQR